MVTLEKYTNISYMYNGLWIKRYNSLKFTICIWVKQILLKSYNHNCNHYSSHNYYCHYIFLDKEYREFIYNLVKAISKASILNHMTTRIDNCLGWTKQWIGWITNDLEEL